MKETLLQEELTTREVADRFHVGVRVVRRVIATMRENGHALKFYNVGASTAAYRQN